jgi:hypothetical protein
MKRYLLLSGLLGLLLSGAAAPAFADNVIFNSVPSPLPGNVISEGFECCQVREFGDGIVFPTGTGGTLTKITVIMSSWACSSGNWSTAGTCITKPKDAKFAQPVTMNIYNINDSNPAQPKAGVLLGTVTTTFQIPYRPSSDTLHCPDGTHWYSAIDNTCYHGIAAPITFDFTNQHISLPSQVVVGVAFNTTHAGPNPIGPHPCNVTSQGCPYDSLNVSADGDVFFVAFPGATSGGSPSAASVIDPNGVFVNYISTAGSCNPATTTPGVLEDDTIPNNGEPTTEACWTGQHPELIIRAKCGDDGEPRCPAIIGGQQVGDDDSGK